MLSSIMHNDFGRIKPFYSYPGLPAAQKGTLDQWKIPLVEAEGMRQLPIVHFLHCLEFS